MHVSIVRRLLGAALPLLLTACGGGGGGPFEPAPQTATKPVAMVANAEPHLEGTVFVAGRPGAGTEPNRIHVGEGARGVVGFTLPAMPPGAELVSAKLSLHQRATAGDPYAGLGLMLVDLVDLGGSVDAGDYDTPAMRARIAVLSDAPTPGTKTADVTEAARLAMQRGLHTADFRIYFPLADDGDLSVDRAYLADSSRPDGRASTGAAFGPRLVLVFRGGEADALPGASAEGTDESRGFGGTGAPDMAWTDRGGVAWDCWRTPFGGVCELPNGQLADGSEDRILMRDNEPGGESDACTIQSGDLKEPGTCVEKDAEGKCVTCKGIFSETCQKDGKTVDCPETTAVRWRDFIDASISLEVR